eukprot:gene9592-biopygen5801
MITFSEVSVRSLATSNIVNAPYPPLSGIRAQSGTSGLPTLSFANSPDTGLFNPSVGTLGVVAGGAELVRVSNNVSVLADIVVSSNIIPVKNATQHIGSSNMHWIDTLHISSNTLYVGDTLVLGIDAQTLAMSAGPGQGISITTTGAGETSLASEEGVNVTSVGGVSMHVTGIDKVVDIQSTGAGGIVQLGATKEVVLTAPTVSTVSSNLTVNGTNFTAGIRANSGSAGAPSLSFSNATDTGLFNPSVGTLGVVAGGAELVRVSNTVSVMGDLVVSSNIIPSANATQYIGSSTMHFKEAWIDTLHISSNTLYIGDTAVLGTDDQTVSIRADPGQGISITTTGVGETSLVSESGVNVVAGGGVNMQVTGLNKVVDIQSSGAGGTVQLGATKEMVITTPITTTVTVEDNIIVLNSGEIGPGVTKGEAGITIDRGDALDYQILFRESDDKFVMGPQGSLVPIATETFAANAGNISTGVLGVTMGGTGVSASTGTGSNVLRDNATMSNLTTIGGMISGDGYFNGNVIATSNIIGFSTMESDSNVKHHFEPITDALDKIDAIGAYTFEYRGDDSRKRHAGVIAQQVQRVLPEVVSVHPLKDTLTVAYGNLSSLLLAGVQELRDELNNLKEELKEIRGTVPHANIVYVDVYPIPADDLTHEIAFEFRTDPTEGVRVWIDGTLYGEATGSFHSGIWSGSGPGSFGMVKDGGPMGESSNPWPVTITKPLRRYDNQLGWLSAMEANLGTPDYVYSGPSTFESLTLATDTMFSMDVVIPTNFASSCILFDYGGSEYGLYIGVVRSQDGAYNISIQPQDGSARLLRNMNGFNDGILGEFISLRIPWPIYLTSYEMTGNCRDWVVYGSVDGKSFDVLDTQIGIASVSEVFSEVPEMRHLISLPRDFEIDDDNTLGNAPVGSVGLNYVGIIAYLVSAMQEQANKIEDLQARISHGVVVPGRYLRGFYSEVVFVSSDVDGREYLMRRLPDRQNAVNLMARINSNLNKLVQHLVAKYPKNPVVRQLYNNYNPDALSEGGAELGYTSYSVNKGEKIVLCLRQRDHELVEENILMYVAIHKLGHLATDEVGHTPKFWSNFKWILGEAMSIRLYTKVDFDNEPQKYCGINITSSIV